MTERLLAVVREDMGRADVKASVLLSVALGVPALVTGFGQRLPARLSPPCLALVGAGALMWVLGSVSLVRAMLPRSGTERVGPGITFFADVVAVHGASGAQGVADAVTRACEDVTAWLLTQIVDASQILADKYRCIRWGVGWLLPGALLTTAGLLLG
ncbi:Pycsar system effector family protein [Streptomyces sp. V3I8]|uniref:Pycsar system effector family protein n=1 Tax=Streptomyces sp. V3I8 TaxID=3042279 RepID=UPI0027D8BFF3|nr:Pycsar system effector family protein [Streptomyces sp. V3I8]